MSVERISHALTLLQIQTLRRLLDLHRNEFTSWPSRELMESDIRESFLTI
jgi:hypothetical protein